MMKTLHAAIIGLGVGEQHIAGYESDPRCRVVALCDTDAARLAEVGARHRGKRLVDDPTALLAEPGIDVVSIASYDDSHHAQVVTALETGKHVFVEKPICLTAEELADIRSCLAAHPRQRLSSNLILRRAPRFAWLRDQVRARALGTPYYLEADYNYGRLAKIVNGWRGRLNGYSAMHGGGIHMIDLLLWILGERPAVATAFGNAIVTAGTGVAFDDCVVALLKFPSGAIAKVTANFGCVFPHHHNLTVYGTTATFVHDRLGARVYDSRDPEAEPRAITEAYPGAAKGDMLPAFVRSILDDTAPEVTQAEVLDAMTVSIAIVESARLGRPVAIQYG